MNPQLSRDIDKRRTFAIISHPDAGKTTVTEKLLLYSGAIQLAGTVKAKRGRQFATSDWMEIERQRGISVTSSVLNFSYKEHELNLIDTPGHKDFSEDTYRTLTAVDCALMVVDAAKGIESQTKKLFEICRMRQIPIIAFINKLDRPCKEPIELIDEIESVLGISCYPITWPLGQGPDFRGVYNRLEKNLSAFTPGSDQSRQVPVAKLDLGDPNLNEFCPPELISALVDEIAMLDGAGADFSRESFLKGNLAPVFFGSALNNFGIETLLNTLISLAPSPGSRPTKTRVVDPHEEKFSGFIFKIQANMDPNHRDRVAFLRICSGKFERGMKVFHSRLEREFRLGRPTQFLAQDRSLVDTAVAGDIVGVHDPGKFLIGDSFTEGEKLHFTGIPVFAPENFARVILRDPLKSKQLNKALTELSEEGVLQLLFPFHSSDKFLGAVGILQFDVVKFRIEKEYNLAMDFVILPYTLSRWVSFEDKNLLESFEDNCREQLCKDKDGHTVVLVDEAWRLKYVQEKFPKIALSPTAPI